MHYIFPRMDEIPGAIDAPVWKHFALYFVLCGRMPPQRARETFPARRKHLGDDSEFHAHKIKPRRFSGRVSPIILHHFNAPAAEFVAVNSAGGGQAAIAPQARILRMLQNAAASSHLLHGYRRARIAVCILFCEAGQRSRVAGTGRRGHHRCIPAILSRIALPRPNIAPRQ